MSLVTRVRRRLHVSGVVQGVGFRPFVFRLAASERLSGFVQNTSSGVMIEVEGPDERVLAFTRRLVRDAPPVARPAIVDDTALTPVGDVAFTIRASDRGDGRAWLPPDLGPCDDCLREQRTASDRRHGHAFISCTNCGPRFSIVETLPFDRARTSMASLSLCADCRHEFETPSDRRFHAQTLACRACGPGLSFVAAAGQFASPLAGDAALDAVLETIATGGIVAVKGVGAYHLVCDARSEVVVARLRERKARPDKPLAVLVGDLAAADTLVELSDAGCAALLSPTRPVVLAPRRPTGDIAGGVARDVPALGVMLPPSPLHVLLAERWRARCSPSSSGALVLTSANASEAPAIIDDAAARQSLGGIADAWLSHDRRIVTRGDDSVVADAGPAGVVPVRLARGEAPAPMPLPHVSTPILAVGGELKAACCLGIDGHAVMAPHVGDMGTAETLDALSEAADHLCRVLDVEPEVFVCDAHPGYLSSRWADDATGGRAVRVQHHHAHAASLMAEHRLGIDERLLVVCFDGTGYGDDGAIWGGEVLDASYREAHRLAHLAYAPLPGGDASIRYPARAAYAWLRAASVEDVDTLPCGRVLRDAERRVIAQQVDGGVQTVPTSSMGRLFDVVAATCGLAVTSTFEGQAAMALEAAAHRANVPATTRYGFEWTRAGTAGPVAIAWMPVLRAVAADIRRGVPVPDVAAAFHDAVADLVARLVAQVASGATRVGLSGGVFQNVRLLRSTVECLRARGLDVLTHRRVPPNDGGLALGQVAVAAARLGPRG